jgi:hypothetical protein
MIARTRSDHRGTEPSPPLAIGTSNRCGHDGFLLVIADPNAPFRAALPASAVALGLTP